MEFNNGTADQMWVIGGWDGGANLYSNVYSSKDGASWTVTSSTDFPARYGHSSVVYTTAKNGSAMYLIDGMGSTGVLSDVWHSLGGTWTQDSPPAFPARYYQSSVTMNGGNGNAMWVLGGNDPVNKKVLNDVWNTLDTLTWSNVAQKTPFPARERQASVEFANALGLPTMYLIGGDDPYGGSIYGDVYSSTDGSAWTLVTGSPAFGKRYGMTAVALGTSAIMVMGGTDGTQVFDDAWSSTDYGATWKNVTTDLTAVPRYGHTAVYFNSIPWVFGGFEKLTNGIPMNDVWHQ